MRLEVTLAVDEGDVYDRRRLGTAEHEALGMSFEGGTQNATSRAATVIDASAMNIFRRQITGTDPPEPCRRDGATAHTSTNTGTDWIGAVGIGQPSLNIGSPSFGLRLGAGIRRG
jgi:hypothetical protein